MVVDLTQLGAALRLTDGVAEPAEPIRSILSRYIGVAEAMVDQVAPDAPTAIQEEAVIRMAAYLYDSPPATAGLGFADAWRNSGAASLVARWQVLRVVTSELTAAAQAIASVSGLDVADVLALVSSWAHSGNTDQIPASKLHNAGGGMGTDTDSVARAAAAQAQQVAENALIEAGSASNAAGFATNDAATAHTLAEQGIANAATAQSRADAAFAATQTNANVIMGLVGRRVFLVDSAVNITNRITDAVVTDAVLSLVNGELTLWKVISITASPYLELVGTVTGGSGGGSLSFAALIPYVAGWAFVGNAGLIPSSKLPFSVEQWAQGIGDIPYSAMDTVLEPWAVVLDQAARDAGSVVEIIPNERLPVSRLLPGPTGLDDGLVATIASGAWTAAVATGTTGVAAKVWRLEIVKAEDVLDFPGEHAGEVYIRQRYLDTYDASGVRTSVQDVGNGFLSNTGSRVISIASALDIKELLAQSSISAVMNLITSLPTLANATFGEWYGLAPNAGKVVDVYYKRSESTTEQLFIPQRLPSALFGPSAIHGYTTLSADYGPGGALSPGAEIVELIEISAANGNTYLRLIVPVSSPLAGSPIGNLLYWKGEDDDTYVTEREITLTHDSSLSLPGFRRYLSTTYSGYRFVAGAPYTLKWRVAGAANDLNLHSEDRLVKVSDQEDLLVARGQIQSELYKVEDRLVALEAAPAAGGAFPTTRTSIFSATVTSTNVVSTLDEAFLPNQLYELTINSFTTYLILSPEAGAFRMIMPVPDEVGTNRFEPIFLFIQGSIGSTNLAQFNLQQSTAQSAPVVINKLT